MNQTELIMRNEAATVESLMTEYQVFGPGYERFPWPIYHYQSYPQAGYVQPLQYFQVKQGGSATDNGEVTNNPGAGQFPQNQRYIVDGLEAHFTAGEAVGRGGLIETNSSRNWTDTNNVLQRGYTEFYIGQKYYARVFPLMSLVPSFRLMGGAALAAFNGFQAVAADRPASLNVIDYANSVGGSYSIGPAMIEPVTAYYAQVSFPSGAVSVSNANCRLGLIMNGVLIQQRQ